MEVREIRNKGVWEEFLSACSQKTFLQAWNWGEFQKIMREEVWRLGIFKGDTLVATVLVVKVAARRGTFLLVPHGPVTKEGRAKAERKEVLEALLSFLKILGKEQGAAFIRFNPVWERSQENTQMFRDLGFRPAPIQTHPEASWKLDISPDAESLLKGMRKTTRYLIRQTVKNEDLVVEQSTNPEDVALFSQLHEKVSKRQQFIPFSIEYLQNEFAAFSEDGQVKLFFARYKGEVIAASFVVYWSGIAFYHHAASLPQYAKLSAPYKLQWEVIAEAKRRGCILYDFWGYVDPASSHPWAGPTLFKMGFGGRAEEYVKTQDYLLSFKYFATALFETIRRIRRGL
ncbi:MAG: peptidoglycan bridge formation glycyltransferase FemA/FemB family protein [archaeon]|nr:peptidoglycan bridge formation glycyltransferase FemA/FemB family protein [archaeon]